MNTIYQTTPGYKTGTSIAGRHLFADSATRVAASPLAIIDGSLTRDTANTADTAQLRAGLPMGKITSSGKYRNSVIGVTPSVTNSGATTVTVTAATATEITRLGGAGVVLKLIGPPSAAGTVAVHADRTVSSVGATSVVLGAATTAAMAAGSIIAPADGAWPPITFVANEFGLPVTDQNGSSVDQTLSPFYEAGRVDTDNIEFYSSLDASAKAYLKDQIRETSNTNFTFTDDR